MLALMLAALAVGLGNFGASVSIGLSGAAMATRIKVGAVFVVFEVGMPLVGLLAGQRAARALGEVSGYIGGALLITIGAWVLIQAFRAGGQAPAPPATTTACCSWPSRCRWTTWSSDSASASSTYQRRTP